MKSNYKRLGDFIKPIKVKNRDLKAKELLGININKYFMPSVANVIGTDLSRYKVVQKHQFACNRMHVGRDYRIPIAISQREEPFMVSPAYDVFEIENTSEVLPEYLMMWFSRAEFDRNAWFYTDADVRGGLPWQAFIDMQLPIPHIDKQREIVNEYNTIQNRIKLNEQLIQKLEETAQSIYREWFVAFEFPDENGKPYKSNGGEMVWNEELDEDVPEGWEIKKLIDIATIKGGKRMPSGEELTSKPTKHPYIKVADLGKEKFALLNEKYEYVPLEAHSKISRYIVSTGDLILSIVGTIGIAKIIDDSLNKANLTENCVKITVKQKVSSSFVYHYLNSKEGQEEITMRNVGAVQAKLPIYNIETFPILCPTNAVFNKFKIIIEALDARIIRIQKENVQLFKFKELLLSKMATIWSEEEIVTN